MKDALLKVQLITEEDVEKLKLKEFWEEPTLETLLELGVLPEKLEREIPRERQGEDAIVVSISCLDLSKSFYPLWSDRCSIRWIDASGSVHRKYLLQRDAGTAFTEIVGSDVTYVLLIEQKTWELDRRRKTTDYQISLALA